MNHKDDAIIPDAIRQTLDVFGCLLEGSFFIYIIKTFFFKKSNLFGWDYWTEQIVQQFKSIENILHLSTQHMIWKM